MDADFVIMGLPASGKTTFLAALWHLVEADETECRLTLGSYEGDLAYLNQIAEAWRTFQPVPRTSQVKDANVTIELIDRQTGAKSSGFFPDLAGETFDAQVEDRRCRPELVEGVKGDDGILFFISADVKGDALSVIELNAMMPGVDPNEGQGAEVVFDAPDPSVTTAGDGTSPLTDAIPVNKEWEPRMVPAQVRVVQILSDLLRSPFEPRPRRLAVLISAWDLVEGIDMPPHRWLAVQMPLVDQFLRSNNASFVYEVYGVSAQGVSLKNNAAVDLAAQMIPSRRIQIVGPEGAGHDLTVPLVWLMSSS
jgi:hypothetical protein